MQRKLSPTDASLDYFLGQPSDLHELIITDDLAVVQGCGLGGGSLVNANVGLEAEPGVFQDPVWLEELRYDVDQLLTIDQQHFVDIIKPTPYPDNYPPLKKTWPNEGWIKQDWYRGLW